MGKTNLISRIKKLRDQETNRLRESTSPSAIHEAHQLRLLLLRVCNFSSYFVSFSSFVSSSLFLYIISGQQTLDCLVGVTGLKSSPKFCLVMAQVFPQTWSATFPLCAISACQCLSTASQLVPVCWHAVHASAMRLPLDASVSSATCVCLQPHTSVHCAHQWAVCACPAAHAHDQCLHVAHPPCAADPLQPVMLHTNQPT